MNKIVIIKRNGRKTDFDSLKIEQAIQRANEEVSSDEILSDGRIRLIADEVRLAFADSKKDIRSADIQNCVESKLVELGSLELAKAYITYRYRREIDELIRRESSSLEHRIRTFFSHLKAWFHSEPRVAA